jgi:hypothetical protein
MSGEFGHLVNWRKGLDLGEGEEEGESRPGTSEGTVRGEGDEVETPRAERGTAA